MAYTGTYYLEIAAHSTSVPAGSYDLAPKRFWVMGVSLVPIDAGKSGSDQRGLIQSNPWGYKFKYDVKGEPYVVAGDATTGVGHLQSDLDGLTERLAARNIFVTGSNLPRTCDVTIGTASGLWWNERLAAMAAAGYTDGIPVIRESFPTSVNTYNEHGTFESSFAVREVYPVFP